MNLAAETESMPLRICVIASTYPRFQTDYAVPWLRESVRQLTLRGHAVTVLAPAYRGLPDHDLDGVQVRRFRYCPRGWETLTHEEGAPARIHQPLRQLTAAPYVWAGCRAARRLAQQTPFDIIHAHWPFPHSPIGAAAARVNGVPLVVNSHGAEFAIARRKAWVQPILRRALRRANLSIANSNHTAAQIRELSGVESLVIPYGTTVFPQEVSRRPGPNKIPRILFTGRLIERKGVEFLVRAAARVLQDSPAEFVVCGDGPLRPQLEQLAHDLNLDGRIQFRGFVGKQQLNDEYARCDIWVNPAIVDSKGDTEGLGVGAIEAYAHGKPVVASDVGGIPDAVIHGKTGLLVPQRHVPALSVAMLYLMEDRRRAEDMGAAGREFAQNRFGWDPIIDQLEDAYYGLLGRRCARRTTATAIAPAENPSAFAPSCDGPLEAPTLTLSS